MTPNGDKRSQTAVSDGETPRARMGESRQHLIKQSDVQGEAEAIPQVDLVRQGVAKLAGCGGRVRQEGLRGAVHEGHRQHDGFLRLSGLRV